jgi:hypothetical protein
MMSTRKTTDEIIACFMEKIKDEHRPHVRSVLSDLIFYVEGSLSYHHAPPFVRALLTNKLSYIAQRAGDVDSLYLGVYGEFIYEYVPPEKLMEKT